MNVTLNRTKIKKLEENKVVSPIIFEPRRRKNIENLKFHDQGIFSKRIFGNFYKCDCGNIVGEGFCESCGTRVISPRKMPDFFIDLSIKVPVAFAGFDKIDVDQTDASDILSYKKFVYEGNVLELNEEKDTSGYDTSKVLIGIEALMSLGVSQEWIDENTVDYISIPHTSCRPIVIDNGDMPLITNINLLYSNIIESIGAAIDMHEYAKDKPFYLMEEYNRIVEIYNLIISSLFDELQNVKYSILKSEIISCPVSGAIRAVLTNRHDVNEDVLIVGDTLVETLWPYLYKKHYGSMALINEELVRENYLVLVNRPPSISHMSTISMMPRIASVYPFGKTEGTNRCLLHNYDYVSQAGEMIGVLVGVEGDIEKFGQGFEDGVDTCGVRTIGMNPIVFDGLAADTDGDVLLVIALYSKLAITQARRILPSKCYTNYANGSIRNHIIDDFIYAEK